jgi:hypothetical protein
MRGAQPSAARSVPSNRRAEVPHVPRSRVEAPLFLVGAERSGTTMLRLMLDHHPEIAFHSEFEFAVDLVSDAGEPPPLEGYLAWLATNRAFRTSGLSIDPSLGYLDLVDSFLAQKRERDGKRIVGATVHRHFDRLIHLWPDARFIHLLRDGRDVARSSIRMGWAGNLWFAPERWIHAESVWDAMCRQLPAQSRLEVRYEDLVCDPVPTLERVCAFAGVRYAPAMLTYPADTTYEAPDRALAHQWRSKLEPDDIRLVEARIGALLVRRGYELSGVEPLRVGALRLVWLRLQDKLARIRFRAGRYGLPLLAAYFVARRLRLTPVRAILESRINAIDQSLVR